MREAFPAPRRSRTSNVPAHPPGHRHADRRRSRRAPPVIVTTSDLADWEVHDETIDVLLGRQLTGRTVRAGCTVEQVALVFRHRRQLPDVLTRIHLHMTCRTSAVAGAFGEDAVDTSNGGDLHDRAQLDIHELPRAIGAAKDDSWHALLHSVVVPYQIRRSPLSQPRARAQVELALGPAAVQASVGLLSAADCSSPSP